MYVENELKLMKYKKIPFWFKCLLVTVLSGTLLALSLLVFAKNGQDVVEKHIEKIREHQISQAYYEYTSREFQSATPLETFREFLTLYPALLENKKWILEQSYFQNHRGLVKGLLVSTDLTEMHGEWELVKEGGEWKIASVHLFELVPPNDSPSSDLQQVEEVSIQPLVDKVEEQLKAIQKQDLIDAYYGFVSKDFQKETPLLVFQEFVRDNPALLDSFHTEVKEGHILDDKGYVDLLLFTDTLEYLLKYQLIQEGDEWKVFSLKVVLPTEIAVAKAETDPKALTPCVRNFLEFLSLRNLLEAYQTTSKEFQEGTSFQDFQKFVTVNTTLVQPDFIDIREGEIENGIGKVKANLHGEQGITVMEFRLGFQGGEWKIWAMKVIDKPEESLESFTPLAEEKWASLTDQLIGTISEWEKNLKQQNFFETYHQRMSEGYRSRHSLEDFEEYLITHPIFLDHRSSYFNRLLEGENQAVVRGFIIPYHGKNIPVRFDLVWEEDFWKIEDAILLNGEEPIAEKERVLDRPPPPPLPPSSPRVLSIGIGMEGDEKGVISKPTLIIPSNADRLLLNVDVTDVLKNTSVTLFLEHIESQSSAPPLSTLLEKEGDSTVIFSYYSPKKGWPPGEYLVKVKLSTGQELIQKFFVVEKK